MQHHAAFHLGLQCLSKYPFRGFKCKLKIRFLMHELSTSGIYLFSDAISCSCLTRDAEAYINKNFLKVVQEEEFMDLPKEFLVHFLHSENLRVENEFQVFKGMTTFCTD